MCAREVEGVQCFRKTFLRLKGFPDGEGKTFLRLKGFPDGEGKVMF